jgi:hypothetical protein
MATSAALKAPDVPNAPDPHSENTSGSDEYLGVLQEDVQEDHCGEEEREVENALEAGGKEGEGVTRRQESRMRENSEEHLGPQEMKPFKAGSPALSHIGGCRKTSRLLSRSRPRLVRQGDRSPSLKGHQGVACCDTLGQFSLFFSADIFFFLPDVSSTIVIFIFSLIRDS